VAQDATGTPTSLGIPKYNTAADAPSGKGFNAAMDAIDALILSRGLPDTPDTNEPVYWNGSAWVTNKLTDTHLDMSTIVPAGIVAATAAAAAPTGWFICDGAAVSRTTYANLYAAVGTTYGVGDGVNTFNLPNLKGRTVTGIDAAQTEFDVRGETGGHKEVQQHNHGVTDPGHNHATVESNGVTYLPVGYIGGGNGPQSGAYPGGYNNGFLGISVNSTGITIQNYGTGTGKNLAPYMALHYIIKY
jgi:microcystin-dependent protein